MGSESGKADEQNAASLSGLSGVELLRYFSMQASEIVDARIRTREEQRAKKTAMLLTILGLVGVSGIIALVNYTIGSQVEERFAKKEEQFKQQDITLRRFVDDSLHRQQEFLDLKLSTLKESTVRTLDSQGEILKQQENRVMSLAPELDVKVHTEAARAMGLQVDSLKSDLRTEVDYQRLNNLALGLDLKDRFSNSERDAVVDMLRRLKGSEVVSRSDFKEVLRKIIASFHAASQGDYIDEIDNILGDVMRDSSAIVEVMMNHYGHRVIGSRHPVTEIAPLTSRLQRYLDRGSRFGMVEQQMFWELLLDVKSSKTGEVRKNQQAMRALRFLDPREQTFFFVKLAEFSIPDLYTTEPTFESTEIARVCKGFKDAYVHELHDIFMKIPSGNEALVERLAPGVRRSKNQDETKKALFEFLESLNRDPGAVSTKSD